MTLRAVPALLLVAACGGSDFRSPSEGDDAAVTGSQNDGAAGSHQPRQGGGPRPQDAEAQVDGRGTGGMGPMMGPMTGGAAGFASSGSGGVAAPPDAPGGGASVAGSGGLSEPDGGQAAGGVGAGAGGLVDGASGAGGGGALPGGAGGVAGHPGGAAGAPDSAPPPPKPCTEPDLPSGSEACRTNYAARTNGVYRCDDGEWVMILDCVAMYGSCTPQRDTDCYIGVGGNSCQENVTGGYIPGNLCDLAGVYCDMSMWTVTSGYWIPCGETCYPTVDLCTNNEYAGRVRCTPEGIWEPCP